ncbi:flavin reductase (DIM6/NTAB) family NADH-FMN oxidoreductase RutF [Antricoccus suffuscus]|uniref:Flavin reductase (DIM6/NTAB) family NADH-FMN oxidoreductase RutF n=1 Tax=Antricoccus suffuscus TaxID=1629062 RepID=A0A2T1A3J7_9ACTN|nr:flavin reductase family protein [Antricoccus suffuscus]PRZ43067.1 flavin reductase (DIM6/NTAB) family NADH-FMN oxidoreductase RutF [Antricoccus suffuscus]
MVALRSVSTLAAQPADLPIASIRRSVTPDDFRQVFRGYAAGVVVVTADAGDGPAGFTATSLSTLSLEPPLISFSIANNSSAWSTIRRVDSLTINFLDADQHATAARFATSGIDRFAQPTAWSRLDSGHVVLDDAPSILVAEVEYRWEMGDHHMIVAQVRRADVRRSHAPLVYHAGNFGGVVPTQPEVSA